MTLSGAEVTITARTVAGRETSTDILIAPGQPGWDGSLDGTYRVNPADPWWQAGAATPPTAAAFLNYLSAGPSLYGDSFYSELVERMDSSPQRLNGAQVGGAAIPSDLNGELAVVRNRLEYCVKKLFDTELTGINLTREGGTFKGTREVEETSHIMGGGE